MSPFAHLQESAIQALGLNDDERIERIRSGRWIGYPQAKLAMARLNELLAHPPISRMPNLLIVGDTNNGKTMLVQRFRNQHPAHDNPHGDAIVVPVLYVQAPPVPDEGRLYNNILEQLFAPYRAGERIDKKQSQVLKLLKSVGLRMLIIDEIQHVLAGSLNRQRTFLNVLKYIGNELQVPIVAVGIKDAFRAIQTDPQLANRFEPIWLPRWQMDTDFKRLLVSFERMLPLREASELHNPELANRLLGMSEGLIGELSRILNEAAVLAIKSGKEHIDSQLLDGMDWCTPSERKRQLDRRGG